MNKYTTISNNHLCDDEKTKALYGVSYFDSGISATVESQPEDVYYFEAYIGENNITVEKGDSIFYVSKDISIAYVKCGPTTITSRHIATIVRGYSPEDKSSTIEKKTSLPYVNGCSTKQIFPPERPGDPTLQLLNIPPHSSEQAHHIHSTVRVVYVLSGTGRSVVGMGDNCVTEKLYQGKVIILQKMCPHHFETDGEHLVVLPLHIFSSSGALEHNHPMQYGTHLTN